MSTCLRTRNTYVGSAAPLAASSKRRLIDDGAPAFISGESAASFVTKSRTALLNYAAGQARSGIAGRLRLQVVLSGVNNDRFAHYRIGALPERDSVHVNIELRSA